MTGELIAIAGERIVGRVEQRKGGKIEFTYDAGWQQAAATFPLSLSMPVTAATHPDSRVRPFLEGLLPDSDAILAHWGRTFGVSPRNPFALIGHVGEDCAGAIQFVRVENFDAYAGRGVAGSEVRWLTESGVADRLRALRADNAAWRLGGDTGQFSLAGAQAKTALLYDGRRWGVPSRRTPTTHILKPPVPGLEGFAENEHLCLDLARTLGLPAAASTVVHFDDQIAIVIERFDRYREGRRYLRIHQEDCCQALAIRPEIKYQNQGGPGTDAIVRLLRSHSSEPERDIWAFVRALVFNWLVAGTDAHAKNYAILLGGGGEARLAPLYDIASSLPYPLVMPRQKVKMAMKIGGEYLVSRVARPHWLEFAKSNGLDAERVIVEAAALAEGIPDAMSSVRKAARAAGLKHQLLRTLETQIIERAAGSLRQLRK